MVRLFLQSRRIFSPFFLVFAFVFCAGAAHAQWVSDTTKNTPVCTASGIQQHPSACSDGNDGVFIVWEDFRSNHWDIYAQKLNYLGYPQWAKDGILVCNNTNTKTQPVVASDGYGGAYVVWKEQRRASGQLDLYGQHIESNGTLDYGSKGAAVDSVPNTPSSATSPNNPTICSDGSGNAFVMWEENRSSISSNNRPDIYGNKLNMGGPIWGKSGAPIIAATSRQTNPKIIADGSGGAFIAWENGGAPQAIYATHINAGGSSTWGSGGTQVFQGTLNSGDISRNPNISRDGSQLLVSWETLNSNSTAKGYNVSANRFTSTGSRAWGTPTVALDISGDWNGDQTNSIIFSDDSVVTSAGYAGVMVAYQTAPTKNYIAVTRALGDGLNDMPAYPNHIFTVCNVASTTDDEVADQTSPVAVKTGLGEILVAWLDSRLTTSSAAASSIYAQRIDKTPQRFLGPTPTSSSWGIAVSNHIGTVADQLVLVSRTNGAIAVWRDNRNGTNNQDIYAQLIFRDGTLPIELAAFDLRGTHEGSVVIDWQTASEKNNAGFEIERRLISDPNASNTFEVVASYLNDPSLRGSGSSSVARNYSVVDIPGAAGTYEYRLVDFTLDGERTAHEPKTITVGASVSASFNVGQNMPNPFTESTLIPITLASDAVVTIRISDVLGRIVAMPYDNAPMSAGTHKLRINANDLTNGSGSYYMTVTMTDPRSGGVIYSSPKAMLMQVVR